MDHLPPQRNEESGLALVAPTYPAAPSPLYLANPYGFESSESSDNEVALLQYWEIIRRHARLILLTGLLGLIIGFSICIPMKRIYRATTTIEILAMNDNFMNMRDANPINNSMDSDVSEEQTQAQLLSSATLLKRVVARMSPAVRPLKLPQKSASSGWRSLLCMPMPAKVDPRIALVGKTAGSLKVKATPRTRIIEASVESSDPDVAAEFLNTLDQEFIQQNQEARLVSTEHTGDWISHELADARDRLRHSEDALQEYARASGILLVNDNTNVASEKLQQLQQALSASTTDRIAKQSRFELAQTTPANTLADILNDSTLRDTQAKISDLRRQIADLTAVFKPEYSKVRRLKAEIESLETTFDGERADVLNRIKSDYQDALRKESLLSSAYSSQAREVTGQGEKGIQYNILKREVDSNRQLYDAMLQQMKQASIATAMRASNVRVVDAADVPSVPISPNFKLNSALGFAGGLLLSSMLVLVRDQIDRTFRAPGEIKEVTDLTELGNIPNASEASSAAYYRRYYNSPKTRASSRRLHTMPYGGLPDGSTGNNIELDAWQRTPSMMAESFRFALASILFVGGNGSRPRVVVVTSPNPAEGKTTTVSNLAIAAAEIRLRVLVIDADLRSPRMHGLFNLTNERGLSDFLQEVGPDDAISGLIQETSVPHLHVLTAGTETHAAAHLLYSSKLAALIEQLKTQYDMILIDTPPMLQMTDARIIGRQADAVVLVARAGQTSRDHIRVAKERFEEDRIHVLGSMLNDFDPRRASPRYSAAKPRSGYRHYAKN